MPRKKTISDDAVLDAAERVLLARGPHAFTLAEVASASGLAPATLLQRFGTKRGLLLAFARRSAKRASAPFATRHTRSPVKALRAALLEMAAPVADRTHFVNSLALLLEDIKDPQLRAAAARQARAVESRIEALLRAAVKAGELEVEDPAAHATLIWATWNGALIQWSLRGRGSLKAWLGAVLETLLR